MIDTALLWVRAETAMRARRWKDAIVHLRELVTVVDRIDFEYEEWLRALAESLRQVGERREAMACAAYLGVKDEPEPDLLERQIAEAHGGSADARRGLCLVGIYLSRAGQHRHAADYFAAAAMPVHHAIELERAGEDRAAADRWAQILGGERLQGRTYERALARINYGLCLYRLGHDRARLALAEATTAVEEVADGFENEGLRERAFDCYQLLARVGLQTGAFENVAEGYLNSVRILKDDGLKLDALRLYEAFVAHARRAGEHHAVATILREAAEFCTRAGLPYADDLRLRAADAWMKTAAEALSAGHPLQIVENAYLAAAESLASVRAFRQVAEVYRRMSALELPTKARERCHRILRRLSDAPADPPRPIPVPDFLKQLPDYEEVWYVDLAEWETGGDPALTAAGVMADRRFPDYVRRHALLLVLDVERRGGALGDVEVVRRLESIRAYPVIDALEHLFRQGDAAMREAVAGAMGSLRFKRSFTLLQRALRDDEPKVRAAAASSIAHLVFPHAF
ncbi:MAG: hypothetical protein KC486_23750, partial [Myxococcales bacterium]|nr:hypothetical protein [Myxococcales bacterium]